MSDLVYTIIAGVAYLVLAPIAGGLLAGIDRAREGNCVNDIGSAEDFLAAIDSTIGTARGNTQGSWRPLACKTVAQPFASTVF